MMKARKSILGQHVKDKALVANLAGDETIDEFPDTRSMARRDDASYDF